MRLEVRLLGDTRIAWLPGDAPVRLGRQGEMLLAYLMLHRQSAHRREFLADLLWPDADETGARLSTLLWRVNARLAPPADDPPLLAAANGTLTISEACPVWLDVTAFEAAVRDACGEPPETAPRERAAALESALDLYRGELLPRCAADWVLLERRRLEMLFCTGLKWLLDHHRAAGRVYASIEAGERLLRQDPLREDVHCEMIRLFNQAGHRQSAIRQYRWCRELLASELGVEPMARTEALFREVLRKDESSVGDEPRLDPAATMAVIGSLRAHLDEVRRKLDTLGRIVGGPGF